MVPTSLPGTFLLVKPLYPHRRSTLSATLENAARLSMPASRCQSPVRAYLAAARQEAGNAIAYASIRGGAGSRAPRPRAHWVSPTATVLSSPAKDADWDRSGDPFRADTGPETCHPARNAKDTPTAACWSATRI